VPASAEATPLADASFDIAFCDHSAMNPSTSLGTWIRLFLENGLIIEELLELCPPANATSSYRDGVDLDWAVLADGAHLGRESLALKPRRVAQGPRRDPGARARRHR
jgi:hypothetical protein